MEERRSHEYAIRGFFGPRSSREYLEISGGEGGGVDFREKGGAAQAAKKRKKTRFFPGKTPQKARKSPRGKLIGQFGSNFSRATFSAPPDFPKNAFFCVFFVILGVPGKRDFGTFFAFFRGPPKILGTFFGGFPKIFGKFLEKVGVGHVPGSGVGVPDLRGSGSARKASGSGGRARGRVLSKSGGGPGFSGTPDFRGPGVGGGLAEIGGARFRGVGKKCETVSRAKCLQKNLGRVST